MDITIIGDLLHEARLVDLAWDEQLRRLRMAWKCLRKNIDDNDLTDTPVDLIVDGVRAMGVWWQPAAHEVRPSQCPELGEATVDAIRERFTGPGTLHVIVESQRGPHEFDLVCGVEWIVGDGDAVQKDACGLVVDVVCSPPSCGPDALSVGLVIFCDMVEAEAGGVPLTLQDWHDQFDAWWKGWQEYWDHKYGEDQQEDGDEDPVPEDKFIPAGDDEADLTYRPPDRPAFDVRKTDVPDDLIRPIRDFHEGHLAQDWRRMAIAYPDLSSPVENRPKVLEERFLGPEWGRWQYIRRVDDWWQEGRRACVTVRGIEHWAPMEGDPTEEREIVISYGLRELDGRWIIWTWSQR